MMSIDETWMCSFRILKPQVNRSKFNFPNITTTNPRTPPPGVEVNQRSGNSSVNLWDLSNISFGALLSEASVNANVNVVNYDTFDDDIARLKATNQSTFVTKSSISDAEETCNAFLFRKITSSRKVIPAQLKDAPITSYTKNVSSSLSRLDNQLHTNGVGCSHTLVDSQPETKNVASE